MEKSFAPVIEVTDFTKDYGSGRGVFNVSFSIEKGEAFGYLGPNGAGKSTTIRHILGFSAPDKGSVKLFGRDSFRKNQDVLSGIGYVPGDTSLPPYMDGKEFLYMMQDLRGERREDRLKFLLDYFEFNPSGVIKRKSLGDKRKLAVVSAFINDPEVLVLDEPTSGLDPIMQDRFVELILQEKKRGKTIFMSSHVFSEVNATCDTICIIKEGKHVSTAKKSELIKQDRQTFLIRFEDSNDLEKYLLISDGIVKSRESDLTLLVSFMKEHLSAFVAGLNGFSIKSIEEKTFSLADYFSSFYKKEEKADLLEEVAFTKGGKNER